MKVALIGPTGNVGSRLLGDCCIARLITMTP